MNSHKETKNYLFQNMHMQCKIFLNFKSLSMRDDKKLQIQHLYSISHVCGKEIITQGKSNPYNNIAADKVGNPRALRSQQLIIISNFSSFAYICVK
jgi:hypothetical protein